MRRLVCLLGTVLLAVMLTACSGEPSASTQAPKATESPEPIATPQMETITIFTIDTSSMSLLPTQVKKKSDDDSPSYITDLVLENLEDDSIGVSEVSQEDDKAIIVFKADTKPIKGCDAELEPLILDCFANSILDNVEGVHSVVFRSDIGAYKSANGLEFGEDEEYASK